MLYSLRFFEEHPKWRSYNNIYFIRSYVEHLLKHPMLNKSQQNVLKMCHAKANITDVWDHSFDLVKEVYQDMDSKKVGSRYDGLIDSNLFTFVRAYFTSLYHKYKGEIFYSRELDACVTCLRETTPLENIEVFSAASSTSGKSSKPIEINLIKYHQEICLQISNLLNEVTEPSCYNLHSEFINFVNLEIKNVDFERKSWKGRILRATVKNMIDDFTIQINPETRSGIVRILGIYFAKFI